jgi:UDP-N-acetylmuramate--alanine ligase
VDNPEVAELAQNTARSTLTYAIERAADVRGANLRADGTRMHFDLLLPGQPNLPITLNLPGRHNVLNALAAATIGWHLGVEPFAIARALERFQGVGRRFHIDGEFPIDAGRVLLVDDYGHHPRELAAVMQAAREGWPGRRLVIVFQPHRYTRTRDLMDDFAAVLCEADALVLTDVYPAGEVPIAGADGRALARAVRARGKTDPVFIEHPRELATTLPALLHDGDLVLLLGAGDIGAAAAALAQRGHLKSEQAA